MSSRNLYASPLNLAETSSSDDPLVPLLDDDGEPTKPAASYSPFVAWAFVINYVLGVGILGMPYAFSQAGIVLSVVFLGFITFITIVATMWIIEICSRAQALYTDDSGASQDEKFIGTADAYGSLTINDVDSAPRFEITSKKFEINELCGVFLGKWGKITYEICLVLYMYGSLWSYTAVFASSMTDIAPLLGDSHCNIYDSKTDWTAKCEITYLIFVAIYACICLPLTCLDLTEQVLIQVFLCALRWAGLFVMYISVAVAMSREPYSDESEISGPPYIKERTVADVGGFGIIFTTAVFSQLIQHSAPGLAQPIKDKKKIGWVFGGALTCTMILYMILGILCALYFGSETNQLVTLNWSYYDGYFFEHSSPHNYAWAKAISYFVRIFPVIAVVSAFPLLAITLGNNIFYGLPAKYTGNHENKWIKLIIRVVAAIPPIIGGGIEKKLAIIIEVTGMAGFFIGFIIPGILQWQATRTCVQKWGEVGRKTPFTWHLSHSIYAWLIVLFGIGAFGFTIYDIAK